MVRRRDRGSGVAATSSRVRKGSGKTAGGEVAPEVCSALDRASGPVLTCFDLHTFFSWHILFFTAG